MNKIFLMKNIRVRPPPESCESITVNGNLVEVQVCINVVTLTMYNFV